MKSPSVTKFITVRSTPEDLWRALTDVNIMPKWMSETEMTIATNWTPGSSIIIQGRWHKMRFRNTGTVLRFDHNRVLSYSHLSSLSRLPDQPENHSILTFSIDPAPDGVLLGLTLSNAPTFEIHKHLDFYWNVTLDVLCKFVEHQLRP